MNPEQISIFDINHHDNHKRDLCVELNAGAPKKLTITCTAAEPLVSPTMERLWHQWATNTMDQPDAEPTNMLLIDQSKEPHEDDPVMIIRSPHLRWTVEHALDVLIAKYPSYIATNWMPSVGQSRSQLNINRSAG